MIAHAFPPVGGGGVQRSAKLVRYLPETGWEPVVVTGPGVPAGRWSPTDERMLDEVPPEVEVHRTRGPEPGLSGGWRARSERWLGLRSPFSRWWLEAAVATGRKAARGCDLVYASIAPFESGEAAVRLAREFAVPWVADLRDPWALDEMKIYPSPLHRAREVARMGRVLGAADAVVMNTPEAARRVLERFPALRGKPLVTITNGFDADDFEGPVPSRADGCFRIVHTGYLHTELGRQVRSRGAIRGALSRAGAPQVDILTRSHVYLLEALRRVVADDPSAATTVELHLAGVLSSSDREASEGAPVRVVMPGYLEHRDSVALLRTGDLLFLPMQDLPPGARASIVPGKTYEYLATGQPILAAVPDGDARDFLEAAGNALLCRPGDADGMARLLAGAIARWRAGDEPVRPRPEAVAPFERRVLTRRLAEVFDGLAAGTAPCHPEASPSASTS